MALDLIRTVPENEMVFVQNDGMRDFKKDYANRTYVIEPGKRVLVPYFAMCMWFGDPRAMNGADPNNRETQWRTQEIDRLSVYYGLCDDSFVAPWEGAVATNAEKPYKDDGKHPSLPDCSVYEIDGTTKILTVIDDPFADSLSEASTSIAEKANMAQAMRQMQENYAKLTKMIAEKDPELAAELAAPSPDQPQAAPPLPPATDDLGELAEDPQPGPDDVATVDDGAGATPRVPQSKASV